MKNKNKILCMIGIVIIVILIVFHVCKKDVWDINADKLINTFNVISGDADIEDLSEFIPFEWDALNRIF